MEDPYQKAIEINDDLVCLVDRFQNSHDNDILFEIFTLLESVTMQEIASIIRKSGLPKDLRDDMKQEAYLKLRNACVYYSYARCPVFITFWRRSLKNQLIKDYQKHWRHNPVREEFIEDTPDEANIPDFEKLKNALVAEFSTWDNKEHSALAIRVLNERVLKDPDSRTHQKEIADEFSITQAHVSNWERWIKKKILEEHSSDFI